MRKPDFCLHTPFRPDKMAIANINHVAVTLHLCIRSCGKFSAIFLLINDHPKSAIINLATQPNFNQKQTSKQAKDQ